MEERRNRAAWSVFFCVCWMRLVINAWWMLVFQLVIVRFSSSTFGHESCGGPLAALWILPPSPPNLRRCTGRGRQRWTSGFPGSKPSNSCSTPPELPPWLQSLAGPNPSPDAQGAVWLKESFHTLELWSFWVWSSSISPPLTIHPCSGFSKGFLWLRFCDETSEDHFDIQWFQQASFASDFLANLPMVNWVSLDDRKIFFICKSPHHTLMESASGMMPPACRGRANSMAGKIIIETETLHLGILLRVPYIHIDTESLNSTLYHLWRLWVSIHRPKSWLVVSLVDLWRAWSYKHFGIPTGKPEPFPCNSHYQEKRSTSFQKQNWHQKPAVFRKSTVSVLRLKWQIETQTLIHWVHWSSFQTTRLIQRSNAMFTSTPCMASKTFLSFSFSSRSSRMRRSFKVLTVNLHRHEMEQSVSQGNRKESLSLLAHHGLRILIGHCHVPGSRKQGMHQNH